MATLTAVNAITNYQHGDAAMTALIGLRNVTAGDTLDVATVTQPEFQVINRAVVMGTSDFVAIAANWTGTVVTMPPGLNKSSGNLLVWGCLSVRVRLDSAPSPPAADRSRAPDLRSPRCPWATDSPGINTSAAWSGSAAGSTPVSSSAAR